MSAAKFAELHKIRNLAAEALGDTKKGTAAGKAANNLWKTTNLKLQKKLLGALHKHLLSYLKNGGEIPEGLHPNVNAMIRQYTNIKERLQQQKDNNPAQNAALKAAKTSLAGLRWLLLRHAVKLAAVQRARTATVFQLAMSRKVRARNKARAAKEKAGLIRNRVSNRKQAKILYQALELELSKQKEATQAARMVYAKLAVAKEALRRAHKQQLLELGRKHREYLKELKNAQANKNTRAAAAAAAELARIREESAAAVAAAEQATRVAVNERNRSRRAAASAAARASAAEAAARAAENKTAEQQAAAQAAAASAAAEAAAALQAAKAAAQEAAEAAAQQLAEAQAAAAQARANANASGRNAAAALAAERREREAAQAAAAAERAAAEASAREAAAQRRAREAANQAKDEIAGQIATQAAEHAEQVRNLAAARNAARAAAAASRFTGAARAAAAGSRAAAANSRATALFGQVTAGTWKNLKNQVEYLIKSGNLNTAKKTKPSAAALFSIARKISTTQNQNITPEMRDNFNAKFSNFVRNYYTNLKTAAKAFKGQKPYPIWLNGERNSKRPVPGASSNNLKTKALLNAEFTMYNLGGSTLQAQVAAYKHYLASLQAFKNAGGKAAKNYPERRIANTFNSYNKRANFARFIGTGSWVIHQRGTAAWQSASNRNKATKRGNDGIILKTKVQGGPLYFVDKTSMKLFKAEPVRTSPGPGQPDFYKVNFQGPSIDIR